MPAVSVDLSDPALYNPVYIPLIADRNRYLILYGGRDSAKSYSAAQIVVHRLLSESYCKCVLLRKIYADIRDSQFQTIIDVIESWGLESLFTWTVSPMRIQCVNGNSVIARGLDRPAKLKSVKDPSMVWVEEADEIGLQEFIKTDTSIRHSNPGTLLQMILTFNPEHEEGWIFDQFFPPKADFERDDGRFHEVQSTRKNATILHTTYQDNRFCTPDRAELYESLKHQLGDADNWYRVYCLGLWGNALKGLVFPNVSYRTEFPPASACKVHGYGLDFGFTNDPTAIVECAMAHGELWFRECCYKPGLVNTSNPNMPEVPSIEEELRKEGVGRANIVADSSEPKSITELRMAQFNIHGVNKGRGSIEASLNGMKRYRLNIVGSPNMRKEVRSYHYAEDKEGNSTNKPIDAWNHAIDAARYWFMKYVMKSPSAGMALPGGRR